MKPKKKQLSNSNLFSRIKQEQKQKEDLEEIKEHDLRSCFWLRKNNQSHIDNIDE